MNRPAVIPASSPTQGLKLPMPIFVSAAYVTAAAVKAPASILPSRAMLMTPDRSEKSPPSAASTSGVARRIVDQTSANVKTSLIRLDLRLLKQTELIKWTTEQTLRSYKQDDRSLQYLNDVFRHVFRKTVDVNPAMLQNSK